MGHEGIRRSRGHASLVALLMVVALGLVTPGMALAKHPRPYVGKHHTRVTHTGAWELSYMGSSTWKVQETATKTNGDRSTWDEGSTAQWHFGIPTENPQGAAFSVTYPTLCRKFRGLPCPSPQIAGVGPGPSMLVFNINDSNFTPNGPTQNVSCTGHHESHAAASVDVGATYIKATDSYKLNIGNGPLSAAVGGAPDPQCPGDINGVTVLNVWGPPALPPGGPSLNWFSAASVTIPAQTFATYSQIDIPVSLLPRNEVPRNCGIPASSNGTTVQCKAGGSWAGTLVLHRAAG